MKLDVYVRHTRCTVCSVFIFHRDDWSILKSSLRLCPSAFRAALNSAQTLKMRARRLKVLDLYRRCLRSAAKCPQAHHADSMRIYVGMKFRESKYARDNVLIERLLREGEIELATMNSYHAIREEKKTFSLDIPVAPPNAGTVHASASLSSEAPAATRHTKRKTKAEIAALLNNAEAVVQPVSTAASAPARTRKPRVSQASKSASGAAADATSSASTGASATVAASASAQPQPVTQDVVLSNLLDEAAALLGEVELSAGSSALLQLQMTISSLDEAREAVKEAAQRGSKLGEQGMLLVRTAYAEVQELVSQLPLPEGSTTPRGGPLARFVPLPAYRAGSETTSSSSSSSSSAASKRKADAKQHRSVMRAVSRYMQEQEEDESMEYAGVGFEDEGDEEESQGSGARHRRSSTGAHALGDVDRDAAEFMDKLMGRSSGMNAGGMYGHRMQGGGMGGQARGHAVMGSGQGMGMGGQGQGPWNVMAKQTGIKGLIEIHPASPSPKANLPRWSGPKLGWTWPTPDPAGRDEDKEEKELKAKATSVDLLQGEKASRAMEGLKAAVSMTSSDHHADVKATAHAAKAGSSASGPKASRRVRGAGRAKEASKVPPATADVAQPAPAPAGAADEASAILKRAVDRLTHVQTPVTGGKGREGKD